MKKAFSFFVLFALVFQPGLGVLPPAAAQKNQQNVLASPLYQVASDLPGWPLPDKPVPHHEPGQLSNALSYTSQVNRLNADGLTETVPLSGLDAMAADGIDPLAGNYKLVGLDKLLRSALPYGGTSFGLETFSISGTISSLPGSQTDFGYYVANDIAAGDLNNDNQAEQIVAWLDGDFSVNISTGELPGSAGKTTSAPAAVALGVVPTEIDLLVRGYDDALWHCLYEVGGSGCSTWDREAGGGVLLSAPAVLSQAPGEFDVYAILSDNLVYRRTWDGDDWPGDWQLVDDPAYWDPLQSLVPLPELAAPAVIADGDHIDLFRLGPDNTLRWRHYNGSAWEAWQDLGGMLASGPAALALGGDELQVFARGVDDVLWTYNAGWGDWQRLELAGMPQGVAIASAPAVVSPSAGQIDVYVRGSDNHLWTAHFDGSAWSAWSDGGGELASAVGVALLEGQPYLFSQTGTGDLQVKRPGLSWEELAGGLTPCCTVVDTGLVGTRSYFDVYREYSLDVETGYFWGDGRSQTVLGYLSSLNQVEIALFDISDSPDAKGFTPVLIDQVALPHPVNYFRIAVGDFLDRDGIDDIAVVYLGGFIYSMDVIRFNRETRLLEVVDVDAPQGLFGELAFAGTLEVVSGDFDYDGQDEFAFNTIWYEAAVDWECIEVNKFYFLTRVVDVLEPNPGEYLMKWYAVEIAHVADANLDADVGSVGIALAAGDVNGDGKDEIVRTWPGGFVTEDHYCADLAKTIDEPQSDRFVRGAQVISLDKTNDGSWDDNSDSIIDTDAKVIKGVNFSIGADTWNSYGDRLAVGDFDRDLVDEIFYQIGDNIPAQNLWAYQFNPESAAYEPYAAKTQSWGFLPHLVTGDFTGESLRVGPPSYRVQNRVDTLVTVINTPPRHRDLVKDSAGNYQLIVSPEDQACTPSVDPNCTHAKYAKDDFASSAQTISTEHAYTVSAGMESKGCGSILGTLKTCVTRSIDYTHGGNFEKTTNTIISISYLNTVIAADDDKLVFFGTPYAVWEYPVLIGETGETGEYITVAFPLIMQTKFPDDLGGYLNGTCNENWYTPGHQLNNVWSYDPFGPLAFEDYDPTFEPIYEATKGDWSSGEISYSNFQSVSESNTFKHKISAGMQYDAEANFRIKIVSLEASFKGYVNGSYENTSMQSDAFSTTIDTTYSYFLGSQPDGSEYQTNVVFYWSKSGYQVLNYQTEPGDSSTWQTFYNKADPAFILPWYGFPDAVSGQFPLPPDEDAPPCGAGKQLFSPDLRASPVYASVGDTVEISATVRNFSNIAPNVPVTVRFYQGDPSLNVVIGEDTIENLTRQTGPRIARITWTASGTGRQKIYAVIDPDGSLPEVHDEDDWINNNVAYTQLDIGSSVYVDQGIAAQQPYQGQSYSQGDDLQVSFYQPSANLGAVSRFDLKDSTQRIPYAIGKPFELVAYQGAEYDMWDEPLPGFDLAPLDDSPPAVIAVAYSDASIAGQNEASLRLYQRTASGWKLANLSCGLNEDGLPNDVQRFPQDNLIAVPICQTGTFILSDEDLSQHTAIYLPSVSRR